MGAQAELWCDCSGPWGQPASNGWSVGWGVCKGQVPLLHLGTLLKGCPSPDLPVGLAVIALRVSFSLCPVLLPSLAVVISVFSHKHPLCKSHSLRAFPGSLTRDTNSSHWAPPALSSAPLPGILPHLHPALSPSCTWQRLLPCLLAFASAAL